MANKTMPKLLPPHPLAASYPPWPDEVRDAMAEDFKARVKAGKPALIHNPVSFGEGDDAVCLDGNERAKLCTKLGVPFSYTPFQGEEKDIAEANDLRRHEALTIQQRRKRREQAIKEHPEWSNRKLAQETGSDDKTIAADRAKLESRAEISAPETRTGKDGREQPSHKSQPKAAPKRRPRERTQEEKAAAIQAVTDAAKSMLDTYKIHDVGKPEPEKPRTDNVHEVRVAKAVAAAKRDLIQRLKPHLDALEQGVALLRGDAERRDVPPMAGRPKTHKALVVTADSTPTNSASK
jgi:hypothetical protein